MGEETVLNLTEIIVSNGVNKESNPFITIEFHGVNEEGEKYVLMGQMTPDESRDQGHQFLEVAEAADQDAATFKVCMEILDPDAGKQMAGAIIRKLRSMRKMEKEKDVISQE